MLIPGIGTVFPLLVFSYLCVLRAFVVKPCAVVLGRPIQWGRKPSSSVITGNVPIEAQRLVPDFRVAPL